MMAQNELMIEIILKENLDGRWRDWFGGLSFTSEGPGATRLFGKIPDQASLHGILERIRDLNLQIVSVQVTDNT
jgi:hypothetical protein